MAKSIIMQVLTSVGYEPMYPFTPKQILNASFLETSITSQYNINITGITVPLTNSFGNDMGIISFIPTISNVDNITLSINGDTAKPILFSDGIAVRANTFIAGRIVLLKYYNNNFYLILDKNQIGLNNVQNLAPADLPISTATQAVLNNKLNTPVLISSGTNLNSYTTAGLYYVDTSTVAATIANTPIQSPFSLFIEKHNGVKQTITGNSTSGIQTWVRNYSNNVWGQWTQQAIVLYGTTTPDPTIGLNGNLYLKINS